MGKVGKMLTSFINILIIATIISPANGSQFTNHAFQVSGLRNCSYSIEIETTCAPSAETTDHVSARFSDSAGNLVIAKHLTHPKLVVAPKHGLKKPGAAYNGFGRCSIDMFRARGSCMSHWVCSLYLKRIGADGWRPGWVKVLHQRDSGLAVPISYTFYFRKFLPENFES
ncbi:embryo-specific protein ATS3-like [Malania oleifera]|uniref:embryo-specific protein ATS3-like n=1 Tax=Malania oleifera TaxID=397392 RepID=UPI0025ADBF93|nr:embryo-specific protein ATS3-like [Malania oleifera]